MSTTTVWHTAISSAFALEPSPSWPRVTRAFHAKLEKEPKCTTRSIAGDPIPPGARPWRAKTTRSSCALCEVAGHAHPFRHRFNTFNGLCRSVTFVPLFVRGNPIACMCLRAFSGESLYVGPVPRLVARARGLSSGDDTRHRPERWSASDGSECRAARAALLPMQPYCIRSVISALGARRWAATIFARSPETAAPENRAGHRCRRSR